MTLRGRDCNSFLPQCLEQSWYIKYFRGWRHSVWPLGRTKKDLGSRLTRVGGVESGKSRGEVPLPNGGVAWLAQGGVSRVAPHSEGWKPSPSSSFQPLSARVMWSQERDSSSPPPLTTTVSLQGSNSAFTLKCRDTYKFISPGGWTTSALYLPCQRLTHWTVRAPSQAPKNKEHRAFLEQCHSNQNSEKSTLKTDRLSQDLLIISPSMSKNGDSYFRINGREFLLWLSGNKSD